MSMRQIQDMMEKYGADINIQGQTEEDDSEDSGYAEQEHGNSGNGGSRHHRDDNSGDSTENGNGYRHQEHE